MLPIQVCITTPRTTAAFCFPNLQDQGPRSMQQVVDSIIAVVALVQFLKTKNLWSSETDRWVCNKSCDAIPMRVFAMYCVGVSPKIIFIVRANRWVGIFDCFASHDGEASGGRFFSKTSSAFAKEGGTEESSTAIRTSLEKPTIPIVRPCSSLSGSFVVRHQTGIPERSHCISK